MLLRTDDQFVAAEVGSKAIALQTLLQHGFPVPAFLVVPNAVVQRIRHGEDGLLEQIATEVTVWRSERTFAVRSAAFSEDTSETAQAGRFATEVFVGPAEVGAAVLRVIADAYQKLPPDAGFSVIIQEHISPDHAGVLFTRDPAGGRECVLEYVSGHGAQAVSGQAVTQVRCIGSMCVPAKLPFDQTKLLQFGKAIECLFEFPQDIEWAIVGSDVYILQSRPITSLTAEQWRGFLLADAYVEGRAEYCYERSAVSETFKRPSSLAFSILTALHAPGGPVEKAYAQCRVRYRDTQSLTLIGGDVYVERGAEVRSLFPAYDWDQVQGRALRRRFSGVVTSTLNRWRLSTLLLQETMQLHDELSTILTLKLDEDCSIEKRWELFCEQYRTIFAVNLRTTKAVARAELLLGKQLSARIFANVIPKRSSIVVEGNLVGNSASIDDMSPFLRVIDEGASVSDAEIKQILVIELGWRAGAVLHHVLVARRWLELREEARWATVKLISYIRRAVALIGEQISLDNPELVSYATIEELVARNYVVETWQERKNSFEQNRMVNMPPRIASVATTPAHGEDVMLSVGSAEGELVTLATLQTRPAGGNYILVVDELSPDLTQYFDRVKGIVTKEGGLLSHLAIMARERALPVIQCANMPAEDTVVRIDGEDGKLHVVRTTKD